MIFQLWYTGLLLLREEGSFWIVTQVPSQQDRRASFREVRRGVGRLQPPQSKGCTVCSFGKAEPQKEVDLQGHQALFSRNTAQHMPVLCVPGSSPSLQAQHPSTHLTLAAHLLAPPYSSQHWLEHRVLGTRMLPRRAQQTSSRHPR